MDNKVAKRRILLSVIIVIGLVILWQVLQARCSEGPNPLNLELPANIENLYPWPEAKIPIACHTLAFLKSPFAPRKIDLSEDVFKEDGYRILGGYEREGVIAVNVSMTDELYRQFPEPVKLGKMPLFAEAVSLYVDEKKVPIGHIGFNEFDREFDFITILDPFLLPDEHVGKIEILLPTKETWEYQWHFQITWW
jgi:hypothetical protein